MAKLKNYTEKSEVIKLFCTLSAKVMSTVYASQYPADCFCDEATVAHWNYQFDGKIFKFIENAVDFAITNPDVKANVEPKPEDKPALVKPRQDAWEEIAEITDSIEDEALRQEIIDFVRELYPEED